MLEPASFSQPRVYSTKRQPRPSTPGTVPARSTHVLRARQSWQAAEVCVGGTTRQTAHTPTRPTPDRSSQWRNPLQVMHLFPDSRAADRCGSAPAHVGSPRPVLSRREAVSTADVLSFFSRHPVNDAKGHRSPNPRHHDIDRPSHPPPSRWRHFSQAFARATEP